MRNRQQYRVWTDLEKGPATKLGKRKHSVTEPHCFSKVPAPINFVGRGRHQLAGEVGDQGQFRRVIFDLARNVLQIIQDRLGIAASERRWTRAIHDS